MSRTVASFSLLAIFGLREGMLLSAGFGLAFDSSRTGFGWRIAHRLWQGTDKSTTGNVRLSDLIARVSDHSEPFRIKQVTH
jgi:hypothetical protein